MRDLVTPRLRLGVQPPDHRGAGPTLDVGQQPGCAHRVDDPGVPPVVGDPPPPGHRVLGPDRFPAAGLIDSQDLHHGQRFGQRAGDMTSQRRLGDRPGHPVVGGCREHAAEPVRGRGPDLPAQPGGDPRPGRDLPDRLGERPPRAQSFLAAPPVLVPDQPDLVLPVRDIPRERHHPALPRRGDHPALRAPGGHLVGGHRVHDPPAGIVDHDLHDRQTLEPEQPCGALLDLDQIPLRMRTLEQARDLTS